MSEGYKNKGYTSYHGEPLDSATCNKTSLKKFAGDSAKLTEKATAPMTPIDSATHGRGKK